MKKIVLGSVAFGMAAATAWAADAPKSATYITGEEAQQVLQRDHTPATDHNIRVIDMGQGYQMSVSVIHRGSTDAPPSAAAAAQTASRAAARATLKPCGIQKAPANAKVGPPVSGSMLEHDFVAETYIVTKGAATLVTGGTLFGGTRQAKDSNAVAILNGPGCTGKVFGDFHVQNVKAGDIIVIPAGVPHGWSSVPNMVEYLSVRPDPKKVLPVGYVNPGLKN